MVFSKSLIKMKASKSKRVGKSFPEVDPLNESKSIFYDYLDFMENEFKDGKRRMEAVRKSPLRPLRTLWCDTDEVVASGVLDTLTPSQIALQESKFEILTSEASYLQSLNILITLFVESPELGDFLNHEERQSLFGNILEVRKASEKFLSDLAGHWKEDLMLSDICSVVLRHALATFRVYIEYCTNQLRFHRTLQRLMLDRDHFAAALSQVESQPACQGCSLQSFLALPVQRVTRLPLLVDAVQRRAGPQAEGCSHTLNAVNQLVLECNEGVRTYEQNNQIDPSSQVFQTDNNDKSEDLVDGKASNKLKKERSNTAQKRSSKFWTRL